MRSDTITVCTDGTGVSEALAQTEAVAVFKGLNRKDSLRLRLLAEEMMGMLSALTGEVEAKFYIEDENNDFRLHLSTDTSMNSEKREKLLEVSTSGRNSSAVGVMGKLRNLFERAFEPVDSDPGNYLSVGWMDPEYDPLGVTAWSLCKYRDSIENDGSAKEEWDELERSIVANIADEIRIGIKGAKVEMIIYKKF